MKFKLTVKQAILEDVLGCSLRQLYYLKKKGVLIEGKHFVKGYGNKIYYSKKALRKVRRAKEQKKVK